MEIEKSKFPAKTHIALSILLLIVCIPILLGAVLKLFYYLSKDGNPLSDGLISGIQNLVSKLYHGFEPIQYLWSISPTPSIEAVLTTGNTVTLMAFLGFLLGVESFRTGVGAIGELSQAKRSSRKKRLEDEYRCQNKTHNKKFNNARSLLGRANARRLTWRCVSFEAI
ncbi:MAG: hypothetical protein ACI8RT_000260 [Candidatus Azotimanducaceae bacterium]|jgi:hypothetical protein|tara:strand:+ start:86 stop:589 length:504 start_codon:yes stop_codon:yes gene_type:complete